MGESVRRALTRGSLLAIAYWLVIAIAIVLYLASHDRWARVAAYGVVCIVVLGALSARLGAGPRKGAAWPLLVLGMALVMGSDLVELWTLGSPITFDLTPAALTLVGYGLLLVALQAFTVRGTGLPPFAVIDAAIVTLAAALLVWLLIVEPAVGHPIGLSGGIAVGFPALDIALVSTVLPLLARREGRSPSVVLLAGAFGLLAVPDLVAGLGTLAGSYQPGFAVEAGWPLAYATLGSAALHPSAARLGTDQRPSPSATPGLRPWLLGAAVLVPPILLAIRAAGGIDREDLLPLSLGSVALTALVLWRLNGTTRTAVEMESRLRTFMAHPGLMAFIKDFKGRYVYASPEVERIQGWARDVWVGRTDRDLFEPAVAASYEAADAAVHRDGTPVVFQEQYREPDGVHTWRLEKFPMPDRRAAIGLLGVDITERVRAEEAVLRERQLLRDAEDVAAFGSWVWDAGRAHSEWSASMRRLAGLPEDDAPLDNEAVYRTIHPEDLPRVQAAIRTTIRMCAPLDDAFRIVRPDGTVRWVQLSGRAEPAPDGTAARVVGVTRDVTATHDAAEQLDRLAAAVEQAHEALIVTDRDERIVYVNAAFEQITGYLRSEAVAKPIGFISAGRSSRAFARARRSLLEAGQPWQGDLVDRRRDGSLITTVNTASPLRGADGSVTGYVIVKRDVTLERAAEADAERRTRERALISETLRGLSGQGRLEEVAEAIAFQVLKLRGLSLVAIVALARGSQAFQAAIVSEQGAHERFDLPPARSAYLFERAMQGPWVETWAAPSELHPYAGLFDTTGIRAFAYAPLLDGSGLVGVLATGSSEPDAEVALAEHVPALVDFAAIAAVRLAPGIRTRQQTADHRRQIRQIIDTGAFAPVFQPIVSLTDGALEGFEALTRFASGTPPDVQFADAHRSGMGFELELTTLDKALEVGVTRPPGTSLHVNASVALLLAGEQLPALLEEHRRHLGRLLIEVTEHDRVADYDALRRAVKKLGGDVRLAVDDAGAGYASLRHILELQPAVVKLDRSLVAGIDGDAARQAVVSGMQQFARQAGFSLVGEGIETEHERDTLRGLGVSLGQGYLLGRPGPLPRST